MVLFSLRAKAVRARGRRKRRGRPGGKRVVVRKRAGRGPLFKVVNKEFTLIFKIIIYQMQNLEWLLLSIETWQLMSGFRSFKEFATSLPLITNDSAERIIKLLKICLKVRLQGSFSC